MNKIIISLLFLTGLSFCISARENCVVEMNVEGISSRACETAFFSGLFRANNQEERKFVDDWIYLDCLRHIEKQKECDSKSNIVPTILDRNL